MTRATRHEDVDGPTGPTAPLTPLELKVAALEEKIDEMLGIVKNIENVIEMGGICSFGVDY